MEDLSQTLLQFSPKLRDQKEGETTPEYLNYINKKINLTHEEILKFSPFYRISEILKNTEPLSLQDIKEIFNEVKKHSSA